MAEIIKLGRIRKQREKQAKEMKAAGNRARFGVTLAQRQFEDAQRERESRFLDNRILSTPEESGR